MEITNTIITKNATEQTPTAKYQLEYIISNGKLSRLVASIYKTTQNEYDDYMGNIIFENESINCSLNAYSPTATYFEEFEELLALVKIDAQATQLK